MLLLAVPMPVFNDLYHDKRVGRAFGRVLYQALVRIPLGTALLEEVAFRGVLPALFALPLGRAARLPAGVGVLRAVARAARARA